MKICINAKTGKCDGRIRGKWHCGHHTKHVESTGADEYTCTAMEHCETFDGPAFCVEIKEEK